MGKDRDVAGGSAVFFLLVAKAEIIQPRQAVSRAASLQRQVLPDATARRVAPACASRTAVPRMLRQLPTFKGGPGWGRVPQLKKVI